MDSRHATLAISVAFVAYTWYKCRRTSSISDIPGPKNPSWIYGHRWWWQSEEASVVEKRILEEYGAVARYNGSLGEHRLFIADPQAIYHILQGTSYLYEKPRVAMEMLALVLDGGLASVGGDAHKRQRRVISPAFGLVESKALYPYFARCANSIVDKWHEAISTKESEGAVVVDVHSWFAKATLDAIGAGAFDYDFGAVENTDNKFTKSYTNMTFAAFGRSSKGRLLMMELFKWAPAGFGTWMMERDKRPAMVNLRENRTYAHEVAAKLIEEKKHELEGGTSGKDLLSLLVKANSAARSDWRLDDEEIVSQVRTIMFAGHETTAKTLTFALWELAKNRHVQEKLRAEITETLGRIRTRGDSDFAVDDFDSMPYLLAVGKEILRIYPVFMELSRTLKKDDVLPLSKPIVGVSGQVYKQLLVPAGTTLTVSLLAYNLNKDLWGPDAYEFRPARWLDMNETFESPVGVYSNLLTFSGGNRSCIGWRFAVIEMHTFLVALVRHFDFSLPGNGREVRKMRPGLITPVMVGEEHKGPQLLLKVTALKNE